LPSAAITGTPGKLCCSRWSMNRMVLVTKPAYALSLPPATTNSS
jgi:hypothetical protein